MNSNLVAADVHDMTQAKFAAISACTQVADDHVTTPHGGQEWRQCSTFIEDFSVTTNGMGTPERALQAARSAVPFPFPSVNSSMS